MTNRLTLASGSTFSIGAGSSATTVFGTDGAQNLTIAAGATVTLDASFNKGGDTITLTGNASSYTVTKSGSSVILTDASGSITIPVGVTGMNIAFADAAARSLVSTTSGAFTLGTQAVSETAAAVTAGTNSATVGQTFTLTTGADTVPGTAGNDTINGNVGGGGVTTATTGDIVNGGAGSDTLRLTIVDTANPGLLETSSVETVSIRALGNTSINALLLSGVETFTSSGSTGNVEVTNGALATTYGVASSVSGNAANLTVGFRGAETGGAADTAKLSINGVGSSVLAPGATAPTVTTTTLEVGAGVEAISLATAGTNIVAVTGTAAVASLAITGNGTNDITVGTTRPALTIDASASTGTNVLTVGASLTTGDVIRGGTGADAVVFLAAETATVTMSGVEQLIVGGGERTTTFSANPGLTLLDIRSTEVTTIAGITTLPNLDYTGTGAATYNGNSGNVVLNTTFSGTADSLAVLIENLGVTANGSYNAGRLGAAGIENVTVTQVDMLATGTTTFNITNSGMKTIAVTTPGSLALGIDTLASSSNFAPTNTGTNSSTGSNSMTAVNLSGVTGSSSSLTFQAGTFAAAATVTAAAGGSTFVFGAETASDVITLVGGAGVDSFTLGSTATAGSYVVTLGGGATNTFNGGTLAAAAAGNTVNVTGGDGADTITGGANADTINGGAGNDIITGGRGADTIDGGLGADTYQVAVGTAAVAASAEVQTITFAAGAGGEDNTATALVITAAGKVATVAVAADALVGDIATAAAAALNAVAVGAYVATAAAGVVTITYAAAQGNVAPVVVQNGLTLVTGQTTTADAASFNLTGDDAGVTVLTSVTVATGTAGVTAVSAVASDSASTAVDQLTFVSNSDVIDVVAGAIVITGGSAAAAAAGNASISATGLATFHVDDDTLAERITAVAADLDGTVAVREAAVFDHAGQAYLYISDGVAGHTTGDVLIALTGLSTVTTGITLNADGNIIVIG